MSPEHRAILERMRSAADLVRRAVEAAPAARFGQPPRGASGRRWRRSPICATLPSTSMGSGSGASSTRTLPSSPTSTRRGIAARAWPGGRRSGISWTRSSPNTNSSHGCSGLCSRPTGRVKAAIRRLGSCPSSFSPGGWASTPRNTRRRLKRPRIRAADVECSPHPWSGRGALRVAPCNKPDRVRRL
jgi:hypothetical protein